jgi:hypothetical protein
MFWKIQNSSLSLSIIITKNDMKKTSKKTGRKVYLTLSGCAYSVEAAREYFGESLSAHPLAKAILDSDGNVIGSWENE